MGVYNNLNTSVEKKYKQITQLITKHFKRTTSHGEWDAYLNKII